MPGTVDDFMNRFGGGDTIDDSEAQQLHDRFVLTNAADRDFDSQTYHQQRTEYLGKLPDDQFKGRGAQRLQPGCTAGPTGSARYSALGALGGGVASGGLAHIAGRLGLGLTDPAG